MGMSSPSLVLGALALSCDSFLTDSLSALPSQLVALQSIPRFELNRLECHHLGSGEWQRRKVKDTTLRLTSPQCPLQPNQQVRPGIDGDYVRTAKVNASCPFRSKTLVVVLESQQAFLIHLRKRKGQQSNGHTNGTSSSRDREAVRLVEEVRYELGRSLNEDGDAVW